MSDPRDDLAAIVASRRGVTAKVNDTDRWVADAIIAAGWTPPPVPSPDDVCDCGHNALDHDEGGCLTCNRCTFPQHCIWGMSHP